MEDQIKMPYTHEEIELAGNKVLEGGDINMFLMMVVRIIDWANYKKQSDAQTIAELKRKVASLEDKIEAPYGAAKLEAE